ncbi:MAG: metal ABC transporter permease [Cytophagaceae bacterium]
MNIEIILTALLVAIPCSLTGSLLILRRMVMVGDAISHAVLPGIVIAYLFMDTRDSWIMMLGAGITGVFTTVAIEFLHRQLRLQEDASIGIVFTFLFALGVILISYYARNIDLDQDCVLYGEITYVPLHRMYLGSLSIPSAMLPLLVVNAAILLIFLLFLPYFRISTFDAGFATGIGISVGLWNYVLMSMVSFTTVAAFESVGAILVVAFLVVPAASAYLLTHHLRNMMLLAIGFATASVIGGYIAAHFWDVSISGAIASVSGVLFVGSFLLSFRLKA